MSKLVLFLLSTLTFAQTVTLTEATIVNSSPLRTGVNVSTSTYYDSGQIFKNLLYTTNPGFEGFIEQQIIGCISGSTTTCVNYNQFDQVAANYWAGATAYFCCSASGTSSNQGLTRTISSNTVATGGNGPSYTFTPALPVAVAVDDYFSVVLQVNSTGSGMPGWTLTGGAVAETSNVSAVGGIQGLSLPSGGCAAGYADTTGTHDFFILQTGQIFTFNLETISISGSPVVTVSITRLGGVGGGVSPSSNTMTPSGSWAQQTLSFSGAESTGTAYGDLQVQLCNTGTGTAYVDNADLERTSNLTAANTTTYRDEVIASLKAINPGSLRLWDYGLGETLSDWTNPTFTRHYQSSLQGQTYLTTTTGRNAGATAQGLIDFLSLCENLSVPAWISIPPSWPAADYSNLIDFLSGGMGTTYGAKRIANGHSTPYTSTITHIYLEFGNEPWNSAFPGINMPNFSYATTSNGMLSYSHWSNTTMAAMKANVNYSSSVVSLIVNMQAASTTEYTTHIFPNNTNFDAVSVAPYIGNGGQFNNAGTLAAEWNPDTAFAFGDTNDATGDSGNGWTYAYIHAESKPVYIYEDNENQLNGTVSTGVLQNHASSFMAGTVVAQQMLEHLKIIGPSAPQHIWSLMQDQFTNSSSVNVPLYGIMKEAGGEFSGNGAYVQRPIALATQLANASIIGPMYSSVVSSPNTYSISASNSIAAASNVPYEFAYCFKNNVNRSCVLVNTDPVNSHTFTLSGNNIPTLVTTRVLTMGSGTVDSCNNESSSACVSIVITNNVVVVAGAITIPAGTIEGIDFTVIHATGLTLLSVTAQQAVIQYTAPSSSACTIGVTDNSGFGLTVWDVAPGTFANSNLDTSRPNTIVDPNTNVRQVVIGKRTAETGTNGKIYSRSLQLLTSFTGTVTCTNPVSISFNTTNPPVGSNYPDPPAFNSSGFGNVANPTIDWTNQSTAYVDPHSGALIKPASWFGQFVLYNTATNGTPNFSAFYTAATWTNPQYLIGNNPAQLTAITTTDQVFLAIPPNALPTNDGSNWTGTHNLTDLRIDFDGYCSVMAGCPINFWISSDSGQTPISAVQTITIPYSGSSTPSVTQFPSSAWPAPLFSAWGLTSFIQHNLVIPASGSATSTGSVLTATPATPEWGVNQFPTNIAVGSKILVTGATGCGTQPLCTVASTKNSVTLTTVEALGTAATAFKLAGYGIVIQRTGTTGTLNLTVGYDVAYEGQPGFSIADGGSVQCNQNPMTLTKNAAGSTVASYLALLCVLQWSDGTLAYAFNTITGTMWPIGMLFTYSGAFSYYTGGAPTSPFGTDPYTIYSMGYDAAESHQVMKWVYTGAGTQFVQPALLYGNLQTPGQHAADVSALCPSGAATPNGNLCAYLITTALTTQIATCANGLNSNAGGDWTNGMFGFNPIVIGMVGGSNTLANQWFNQQDGIGLFTYTDVTTGNMIGCRSTNGSDPNARHGGSHTAAAWFTTNNQYHLDALNPLGSRGNNGTFAGPYESPVKNVCATVDGSGNCTNWNSNTTITTGAALTCPSSVCGSTYTDAMLVEINGQPCSVPVYKVNTSGTTVTWVDGPSPNQEAGGNLHHFNTNWYSGMPIWVNGTQYTLASVTGTSLTLMSSAGTQSSVYLTDNPNEYVHYPCSWGPTLTGGGSVQGMPDILHVGDMIGDFGYNPVEDGVNMVGGVTTHNMATGAATELGKVLAIIVNSTTSIYLWFQRGWGSNGFGPPTCSVGTFNTSCRQLFSTGWNLGLFPSYAYNSAYWWMDAITPGASILPEYGGVGTHIDVGPGYPSTQYSVTSDGNRAKFDATANQTGFATTSGINVNGYGQWHGVVGGGSGNGNLGGPMETYPSKRVYTGAATEQVWAADWHAYQGGSAGSGGYGTPGAGITVTLVAGQTHTWKLISGFTPNPKTNPMDSWAGRFIYQDISGAASTISDMNNNAYCVVYKVNECISGSSIGDVYFSDSGAIPQGNCWTNQMEVRIPCVINAAVVGSWMIQQDISQNNLQGSLLRRVSNCLTAPSRQYTFTNWRPMPDASWGLCLNQYLDGVLPVMNVVKLPPWPGYDSTRRDDYMKVPVFLGPGAGLAEVRFGYEENGTPTQFYGTSRSEATITAASPTSTNPFNYITADGHSGKSCATGCEIDIPGISGRYVWNQTFRSSDGGTTWNVDGPLRLTAVP